MKSKTVEYPRILRLGSLIDRIGLSRSTIYDRINRRSPRYDPMFPKPIKLGPTAVGWLEADVNAWIEERADRR